MIDEDGFRLNVGIILTNQQGQLFWGQRVGQEAWQFPQGGIQENEALEEALFRELQEEVGLMAEHVTIINQSQHWFSYRLPKRLVRSDTRPTCIGQKQKWFLLKLVADENKIKLDATIKPEFENWRWVSYWFPLQQVVSFKREVYRQTLLEFAPIVMNLARPIMTLDPLDH